ncbi:MAG TPA: hypothetical protein VHP63_02035, partial [candidate division Zixibacteria bacterium]|nr:hypothetical protein [candidate division Zixibacteria bacterium]
RATEGDGTLIPSDSVLTNSSGMANVSYDFSGLLGHSVIRANFRDVDIVFAYLRANTIIPGLGGQGQYMFFTENYSDIKNYNGNPERVDDDPRPNVTVVYAVYEQSQDVVFSLLDGNDDGIAQDNEEILSVLLTGNYPFKTKDSIGIGSTYNEIKAVYGLPDSIEYDPTPPPALVFFYDSLGLVFFTDTVVGNPVDTNVTVFEIHASDFVSRRAAGKIAYKSTNNLDQNPGPYRRIRRF